MTLTVRIARLAPALGLVTNAMRYRGLRCALGVEITGPGRLVYGHGVSIGQGTRIELDLGGTVIFGDHVSISRQVHIVPATEKLLAIGSETTVQDGCRIYGEVTIGRNCIFAPNVFVSSGTHAFDRLPHLAIQEQDQVAPVADKPIKIFSDCWFGINAVVAPGVTIGRGCVIGANSVVTHDLPPYTVVVGAPARVIRQRLDFAPKAHIEAAVEADWPYFYDGLPLRPNPGEDAFVAESKFVLALHRPQPKGIRLSISGNGDIGFKAQRQALPRNGGVVEFAVEPSEEADVLPLFEFEPDGLCRIRTAELF